MVLNMKKYIKCASTDYDGYLNEKFGDHKYSIHYTLLNTEMPSDELFNKFKAEVSVISPYDDAEYYYAFIEQGKIKVYRDSRFNTQFYYLSPEDTVGVEQYDWCDTVIDQALSILEHKNSKVESKIVHY